MDPIHVTERLADYFVVCGLGDTPKIIDALGQQDGGGSSGTGGADAAAAGGGGSGGGSGGASSADAAAFLGDILEMQVALRGEEQLARDQGFEVINTTIDGASSSLEPGSFFKGAGVGVFLCCRRRRVGERGPAVADVALVAAARNGGKQRLHASPPPGFRLIRTSVGGREAVLNKGWFLAVRMQDVTGWEDDPPLRRVEVVALGRGERQPPGTIIIPDSKRMSNNRLAIALGWPRAKGVSDMVFRPEVLDRFPHQDYEDFPLDPEVIPMFAFPQGMRLQAGHITNAPPARAFPFVLTDAHGAKTYVTCCIFHEPLDFMARAKVHSAWRAALSRRDSGAVAATAAVGGGAPAAAAVAAPEAALPPPVAPAGAAAASLDSSGSSRLRRGGPGGTVLPRPMSFAGLSAEARARALKRFKTADSIDPEARSEGRPGSVRQPARQLPVTAVTAAVTVAATHETAGAITAISAAGQPASGLAATAPSSPRGSPSGPPEEVIRKVHSAPDYALAGVPEGSSRGSGGVAIGPPHGPDSVRTAPTPVDNDADAAAGGASVTEEASGDYAGELSNSGWEVDARPTGAAAGASAAAAGGAIGGDGKILWAPKCICLVSHWPFFRAFRRWLSQVYTLSLSKADIPLEKVISHFLLAMPVPEPGGCRMVLKIVDNLNEITFQLPSLQDLPLLDLSFQDLFASLSVSNILNVLALLLSEGKVLFISKRASLVTQAAESMLALLFPLTWDNCYVPRLTEPLLDYLSFPGPFLIGVHDAPVGHGGAGDNAEDLMSQVRRILMADSPDAAIVDLDGNSITTAQGLRPKMDRSILPRDMAAALASRWSTLLRQGGVYQGLREDIDVDTPFDFAPTPEMETVMPRDCPPLDDRAVREAALCFFCALLRNYHNFLVAPSMDWKKRGGDWFDGRRFLATVDQPRRRLLRELLETQMFANFIQRRTESMDPRFVFFDHCLEVFNQAPEVFLEPDRTQLLIDSTAVPAKRSWKGINPRYSLSHALGAVSGVGGSANSVGGSGGGGSGGGGDAAGGGGGNRSSVWLLRALKPPKIKEKAHPVAGGGGGSILAGDSDPLAILGPNRRGKSAAAIGDMTGLDQGGKGAGGGASQLPGPMALSRFHSAQGAPARGGGSGGLALPQLLPQPPPPPAAPTLLQQTSGHGRSLLAGLLPGMLSSDVSGIGAERSERGNDAGGRSGPARDQLSATVTTLELHMPSPTASEGRVYSYRGDGGHVIWPRRLNRSLFKPAAPAGGYGPHRSRGSSAKVLARAHLEMDRERLGLQAAFALYPPTVSAAHSTRAASFRAARAVSGTGAPHDPNNGHSRVNSGSRVPANAASARGGESGAAAAGTGGGEKAIPRVATRAALVAAGHEVVVRDLWQRPRHMAVQFFGAWFLCVPVLVRWDGSPELALLRALGAAWRMRRELGLRPDEASYRALLMACGRAGADHSPDVVRLFYELSSGVRPNAVTYGVYTQTIAHAAALKQPDMADLDAYASLSQDGSGGGGAFASSSGGSSGGGGNFGSNRSGGGTTFDSTTSGGSSLLGIFDSVDGKQGQASSANFDSSAAQTPAAGAAMAPGEPQLAAAGAALPPPPPTMAPAAPTRSDRQRQRQQQRRRKAPVGIRVREAFAPLDGRLEELETAGLLWRLGPAVEALERRGGDSASGRAPEKALSWAGNGSGAAAAAAAAAAAGTAAGVRPAPRQGAGSSLDLRRGRLVEAAAPLAPTPEATPEAIGAEESNGSASGNNGSAAENSNSATATANGSTAGNGNSAAGNSDSAAGNNNSASGNYGYAAAGKAANGSGVAAPEGAGVPMGNDLGTLTPDTSGAAAQNFAAAATETAAAGAAALAVEDASRSESARQLPAAAALAAAAAAASAVPAPALPPRVGSHRHSRSEPIAPEAAAAAAPSVRSILAQAGIDPSGPGGGGNGGAAAAGKAGSGGGCGRQRPRAVDAAAAAAAPPQSRASPVCLSLSFGGGGGGGSGGGSGASSTVVGVVAMWSGSACTACGTAPLDEEIMAGWHVPVGSRFRRDPRLSKAECMIRCPGCGTLIEPMLHYVVRGRRRGRSATSSAGDGGGNADIFRTGGDSLRGGGSLGGEDLMPGQYESVQGSIGRRSENFGRSSRPGRPGTVRSFSEMLLSARDTASTSSAAVAAGGKSPPQPIIPKKSRLQLQPPPPEPAGRAPTAPAGAQGRPEQKSQGSASASEGKRVGWRASVRRSLVRREDTTGGTGGGTSGAIGGGFGASTFAASTSTSTAFPPAPAAAAATYSGASAPESVYSDTDAAAAAPPPLRGRTGSGIMPAWLREWAGVFGLKRTPSHHSVTALKPPLGSGGDAAGSATSTSTTMAPAAPGAPEALSAAVSSDTVGAPRAEEAGKGPAVAGGDGAEPERTVPATAAAAGAAAAGAASSSLPLDPEEDQEMSCMYLSPTALRDQLEELLYRHGERALTLQGMFHAAPTLLWNLWWLCARFGLPLPLPPHPVSGGGGAPPEAWALVAAWHRPTALRAADAALAALEAAAEEVRSSGRLSHSRRPSARSGSVDAATTVAAAASGDLMASHPLLGPRCAAAEREARLAAVRGTPGVAEAAGVGLDDVALVRCTKLSAAASLAVLAAQEAEKKRRENTDGGSFSPAAALPHELHANLKQNPPPRDNFNFNLKNRAISGAATGSADANVNHKLAAAAGGSGGVGLYRALLLAATMPGAAAAAAQGGAPPPGTAAAAPRRGSLLLPSRSGRLATTRACTVGGSATQSATQEKTLGDRAAAGGIAAAAAAARGGGKRGADAAEKNNAAVSEAMPVDGREGAVGRAGSPASASGGRQGPAAAASNFAAAVAVMVNHDKSPRSPVPEGARRFTPSPSRLLYRKFFGAATATAAPSTAAAAPVMPLADPANGYAEGETAAVAPAAAEAAAAAVVRPAKRRRRHLPALDIRPPFDVAFSRALATLSNDELRALAPADMGPSDQALAFRSVFGHIY